MRSGTKEYGMTMRQHLILSAMREDDNYEFDHRRSLEEQILRLQCLVAYLLEKNEQLRRVKAREDSDSGTALDLVAGSASDSPFSSFCLACSHAESTRVFGRVLLVHCSPYIREWISKEQDVDRTNA
jgi:hypothetical protein